MNETHIHPDLFNFQKQKVTRMSHVNKFQNNKHESIRTIRTLQKQDGLSAQKTD